MDTKEINASKGVIFVQSHKKTCWFYFGSQIISELIEVIFALLLVFVPISGDMSFVTWFVYMVYYPISQMIPEAGDYFIYVVYAVKGLFLLLVLFSLFRIISFLIPKLRQRIFDKTYIKIRKERTPFRKRKIAFVVLQFIFLTILLVPSIFVAIRYFPLLWQVMGLGEIPEAGTIGYIILILFFVFNIIFTFSSQIFAQRLIYLYEEDGRKEVSSQTE